MTDPVPNSITADLVLTGPADQILAAKAAILRMEQDFPGVKLQATISTQVATVEYVGTPGLETITIEELIGHPDPGNDHLDRVRNVLRRAQIETVAQLVEKEEEDLLAIQNFGQKSLDLVKEKLAERGLKLKRGI